MGSKFREDYRVSIARGEKYVDLVNIWNYMERNTEVYWEKQAMVGKGGENRKTPQFGQYSNNKLQAEQGWYNIHLIHDMCGLCTSSHIPSVYLFELLLRSTNRIRDESRCVEMRG